MIRLIVFIVSGILLLASCTEKQPNVELDCKGQLPNGKNVYKIFVNSNEKIIIVNSLLDYKIRGQTADNDSRVWVGEIIFDKDDKDQSRAELIVISRVYGTGYISVTKNSVNKRYNFSCKKVENKF
jgi:hypothetical protein